MLAINGLNIVLSLAMPMFIIFFLIIMPITNLYHFFTNLNHINNHYPSIGFAKYRRAYTWLTVIYLPIAFMLSFFDTAIFGSMFKVFLLATWIIIPQIVLFAYTIMCHKELKALTKDNAPVVLY
jgi:hypothetical protein